MSDDFKIIAGFVFAFLAIMAFGLWFKSASCHARFEGSGLQSDWGIVSGCRVNAPGQGWVPSQNYRVL